MAMIKENSVRVGVTGCDYCPKPSVRILDNGRAVCEDHLPDDQDVDVVRKGRTTMKIASVVDTITDDENEG
jgi:hypothetical protein